MNRMLSPVSRARAYMPALTWGSASLHPRLYAVARFAGWVVCLPIETLNVAGPSEGTCPGIEAQSYDLLVEIFRRYR